jgi:hypothetical protein
MPSVPIEAETRERLGLDEERKTRSGTGHARWSRHLKVSILLAAALIIGLVIVSVLLGLV